MPTLFKRSNGIYYYVLTDNSGKRHWISTGQRSRSLAKSFLQQHAEKQSPNTHDIRFDEFVKELIPFASSVYSPGTVDIYSKSLKHLRRVVGNTRLKEVNHRHVDIFTILRLKEISATTVSIELRSLRAIFYHASKWGHIEKNPFSGVKLPRIDEATPRFMTREEVNRLLQAIKESWFRGLIIVAVMTGMRRSELASLTWKQIDFERKLICIQSNGSFKTKTGKKRVVPINSAALEALENLAGSRKGDFVFSSNGDRTNPHWISRLFRRCILKAGLDKELHFHNCRHTCATWLVQDGVSIYHVQKILGHSSVKVTEMYSHLLPEDLHKSVGRIQLELN